MSASGLYTAPSSVSSLTQITVTATSAADPTKSAMATITVSPTAVSGVAVTVSPSTASVSANQTLQVNASVSGSSNTAVNWNLNPWLGSITASGFYTAPINVAVATTMTVTATSAADPTKYATATITLTPAAGGGVSISLTPNSGTISSGLSLQFNASVSGSSNTAVNWYLNPWVGTMSSSGLYTAPTVSSATTVVITATSAADATKSATSTITVNPSTPVAISLSPGWSSISSGQSLQLNALVTGSSNTAVNYYLVPWVGSISASGLYTAPSGIASSTTITVTATSAADSTKSATALVVVNPAASSQVAIGLTPSSATVLPGQSQQLTATVTGSSNTGVNWNLSPYVGSISASGLYTAPTNVAITTAVTVTATSAADPTQIAVATLTVVSSIKK
jgi:hypothetical protein